MEIIHLKYHFVRLMSNNGFLINKYINFKKTKTKKKQCPLWWK